MILTQAAAKRLQAVAMAHPLTGAGDRIHAFTTRDRRSGFARYAERVFAMGDREIGGPGGFARIVTDEDMAALQTAAELAAFFTTIFGQMGGHAERPVVNELRAVVSGIEGFRRWLAGMRAASNEEAGP